MQSVIRCGTADLAWLQSVVGDGAIRHVTWVSSWRAGFDSNGQTSEFPEWCSCRAPVTAFDRRIVPATYLAFLLHACWPQRADERRVRAGSSSSSTCSSMRWTTWPSRCWEGRSAVAVTTTFESSRDNAPHPVVETHGKPVWPPLEQGAVRPGRLARGADLSDDTAWWRRWWRRSSGRSGRSASAAVHPDADDDAVRLLHLVHRSRRLTVSSSASTAVREGP
jgi:hypothetical protein